jgi:hypothetical protein
MPAMHDTFGQPPSVQGISVSPIVFAVVAPFAESDCKESSTHLIGEYSHAPPAFCSPAVLPLRI